MTAMSFLFIFRWVQVLTHDAVRPIVAAKHMTALAEVTAAQLCPLPSRPWYASSSSMAFRPVERSQSIDVAADEEAVSLFQAAVVPLATPLLAGAGTPILLAGATVCKGRGVPQGETIARPLRACNIHIGPASFVAWRV
jgi:hypothetical protein